MTVYHYTKKENVQSILREGLKINRTSPGYTTEAGIENIRSAYGMIPIFCSTEPNGYNLNTRTDSNDYVLLEVNIEGLDYAADFGALVDLGAYNEETGFWFDDSSGAVIEFMDDQAEFEWEDLFGDPTRDSFIDLTGTLAVLENIDPDRIQVA